MDLAAQTGAISPAAAAFPTERRSGLYREQGDGGLILHVRYREGELIEQHEEGTGRLDPDTGAEDWSESPCKPPCPLRRLR